MSIINFYMNTEPCNTGYMFNDIIKKWSNTKLESKHDYIQYLFPSTEKSKYNEKATLLTEDDLEIFKQNKIIRKNVYLALQRMLRFYGIKNFVFNGKRQSWMKPGDHNHLRLTRIIKFLQLIDMNVTSIRLFITLCNINNTFKDVFTTETFTIWKKLFMKFLLKPEQGSCVYKNHFNNVIRTLNSLPPNSKVAILELVGSLCPIHKGHVDTLVESRKMILNQQMQYPPPDPYNKPILFNDTQPFDYVIGIINQNPDSHVRSKMAEKDPENGEYIDVINRNLLSRMAVLDYDWCLADYGVRNFTMGKYKNKLEFIKFEISGTDDSLKYQKHINDGSYDEKNRLLIILRRDEKNPKDNQKLLSSLETHGYNPDIPDRLIVVGPMLPDISSSKIREALKTKNNIVLDTMLNKCVKDKLLKENLWINVTINPPKICIAHADNCQEDHPTHHCKKCGDRKSNHQIENCSGFPEKFYEII